MATLEPLSATLEPIAPEWLGYYPIVIWIISVITLLPILILNKPVRKALPPPIGPSLSEKGDVDPRAARKGWALGFYPVFMLAAAIVGSGSVAPFAAEPCLRRYLQWYIFPLSLVTASLSAAIVFRRSTRIRVADSATLVVCTVSQVEFLRSALTWSYYALVASQAAGTLAPHATRVRAAASLTLCTCAVVVSSMIWRGAVLAYVMLNKARLPLGLTAKLCFERIYLGASLSAQLESAPQNKSGVLLH
jgi:hypothetical protein